MTQGLDTLFNPSKRHMDEEKRRLQSTREEVGDASGGKRIDLASGKVTIRRQGGAPDKPGAEAEAPEAEQREESEPEQPGAAEAADDTSAPADEDGPAAD